MKYSTQELNEAFKKLPEDLQEVFLSVDVTDALTAIGKRYNLHIDQLGELDSETGLVLLGLTHPTEFVSNITKRLGIDRVIASQIASEVNEQVFLRFREMLKEAQKPNRKEEEESLGEPSPSKDALLAAIEHPEGMLKKPAPKPVAEIPIVPTPSPYEPRKPELGRDFSIVAPIPKEALENVAEKTAAQTPTLATTDILDQKLSGQFSTAKTETTVRPPQTEGGKKIDPYRELPV